MPLLPAESDAILIVDSNAVPARLVAFQQFQSSARRNSEILQSGSNIKCFEFPLCHSPNLLRDSPSGASVSLSEQVSGGLIGKGLDHSRYLHATRIVCKPSNWRSKAWRSKAWRLYIDSSRRADLPADSQLRAWWCRRRSSGRGDSGFSPLRIGSLKPRPIVDGDSAHYRDSALTVRPDDHSLPIDHCRSPVGKCPR